MPENLPNQKKIDASLDLLKRQVNDLYTTTYYSPDNSEEYQTQVSDKLDAAIRNSTQGDGEFQNISNISRLFRKAFKDDNNSATSRLFNSFGTGNPDDISSIFQNTNLLSSIIDSYSKTKWITELDNEFDLVCKYMVKLQAALDIKRDAVLCSDSYSKKFLNVRAKGENPSSDKNITIQNNIDTMIKKYDLTEKVEQWYDYTSKYGESFIYCVPYKTALDELLKRKKNTNYAIQESSITDYLPKGAKGTATGIISENGPCIKITLDTSKVLMDVIENNKYIKKALNNDKFRGLSESYNTIHESETVKFEKPIIGDDIELEDDDKTSSNGLFNKNSKSDNIQLKVNGAVLRSINHDKIIPIYIEDIMFGAYYIKYTEFSEVGLNSMGNFKGYNSITTMFDNAALGGNHKISEDSTNKKDMLLRTIAGQISEKIDKAFINSNTDLQREIYLLLKFNDTYNQITNDINMNIVFIPADDIHHLKFRDDPTTHRGISDLWDALVPAKQWITLNLTYVLGNTTRGFDRRVYYVKQSLDTNTAQSLLNVISTIKKGNFGIRQMESVNNILNIVGRFNDFVIPIGPSGDAPIQFDTQSGQQFDFPTDLASGLEESAVNSTGVPLEIVNSSTNMDFAVRYTMTNAKLLRNVLKRQLKMESFLSEIFSKIYKFEFDEPVELEVMLPPPAFLSVTQGSQLLGSVTQYIDAIMEIEMAGEEDDVKNMFKKKMLRKIIPDYISDQEIQDIKNSISLDKQIKDAETIE